MINERGMKKWAPFLLPEHKDLLQILWDSRNDIMPPSLDIDALNELQHLVEVAIAKQQLIQLVYYEKKRLIEVKGIFRKYNAAVRSLTFVTHLKTIQIKLDVIVSVENIFRNV